MKKRREGWREREIERQKPMPHTRTCTGIDLHDHEGQEVPQPSIFKVEEQEIQSRNLS